MGAISHANAATSSAVGAPRIARYTGNAANAARLPNSRGAMNARWRARVSASYRVEGCSSASRQSRMMLKIVTSVELGVVRKEAPEVTLYCGAFVSVRRLASVNEGLTAL